MRAPQTPEIQEEAQEEKTTRKKTETEEDQSGEKKTFEWKGRKKTRPKKTRFKPAGLARFQNGGDIRASFFTVTLTVILKYPSSAPSGPTLMT